jgi:hypothetical protein
MPTAASRLERHRCGVQPGWWLALTLAVAPIAAGAMLHLIGAAAEQGQALVPLGLTAGPAGHAADVLRLLVANARVVALPLAAGAVLTVAPGASRLALRRMFDLIIAATVALNGFVLTTAIAGYGLGRLAPWIPHWPLEATAVATAAGAYLRARHRRMPTRALLTATAATAALLSGAALVETYATPHTAGVSTRLEPAMTTPAQHHRPGGLAACLAASPPPSRAQGHALRAGDPCGA